MPLFSGTVHFHKNLASLLYQRYIALEDQCTAVVTDYFYRIHVNVRIQFAALVRTVPPGRSIIGIEAILLKYHFAPSVEYAHGLDRK